MEQENLNKLRQIMRAEQEAYRAWLAEMPPEEILKHTWEYTAREDILMALDSWDPLEEQVAALLRSSSPLAEVVKEYRGQDVENEGLIDALEEAAKLNKEPPIYRQSAQYAVEHGECDAYSASCKAYVNCKHSIETAINNNYDGYHLGKQCISDVMRLYSQERVTDVLAYTVRHKERDGRFSRDNKAWANSIDTSHIEKEPYHLVVNSHPGVLDGFISKFRREVLERGSAEKSAEKPQRKPKERSDDLEL